MLTSRRIINWLVLSIFTTALMLGCGRSARDDSGERLASVSAPQQSTADCRVIKHNLGETEVCGDPQKVAVLGAHTLDLLLSLDVQPAGYAVSSPHPGEVFDNPVQQIPFLGDRLTTQPVNLGSASGPSLEKLAVLKPDLIVGETSRKENYDLLAQIAPTLQWQDRMAKGQWRKNLRMIATALGRDAKAEDVIQQYEARIAEAQVDLANVVAEHPKLLLLAANRLKEGVFVISADSYVGEILSEVGFQLIAQPNATAIAPISVETLPNLNEADTIIILGWDFEAIDQALENPAPSAEESVNDRVETLQVQTIKQDWEASAIAQSLTASQENRVYFATFYKWNGLNGAIGAELILDQLRQFLLGSHQV